MTKHPVETKVYAAGGGALAGGTVSAFLVWLLGVLVWHTSDAATSADDAIRAVPWPVAGIIGLTITTAGAVVAAYRAPHTHRDAGHFNGSILVALAAVLVCIAALIYISGHVNVN